MGARTNHNNAAEDASSIYDEVVPEEPSAPSIKTLIDMLGTLAVYGNLRRTDLYKHSRMSYGRFVEYVEYMKWKDLIVVDGLYIRINERGRTLYSILA